MGLIDRSFNKVVTGKRVQPLPFTVGDWLPGLQEQFPALKAPELRTLATYRALFTLDPGKCASAFALPGEKILTAQQKSRRSVFCMMRAEHLFMKRALEWCSGNPGDTITCGAVSPVDLTTDWVVQVSISSGDSTLSVPRMRTLDNALVNYGLLTQAREMLAETYATGPGRVTLEPGAPDVSKLVSMRRSPMADSSSPVAYDYTLPIPEGFAAGECIRIPSDGVEALRAAIASKGLPGAGRSHAGELASISLSGGRPGELTPALRLIQDNDGAVLILDLPEERPFARQRTFRAATHTFVALAKLTAQSAPTVSAALRSYVESVTQLQRDPERRSSFRHVWGEKAPAGAVVLGPGTPLPVALIVRSRDKQSPLDRLLDASNWVLAFERTWARGRTQASRDSHRIYLRRGPGLLKIDDKVTTCVRFAYSNATTAPSLVMLGPSLAWFWEATVRGHTLDDGRRETVVLATGLSRVLNILCYGQEYLRLLTTFAWLMREADPDAEIETVTLWV